MVTKQVDQAHFSALTRALFFPSERFRVPAWLRNQVEACAERYSGSRVSAQFESTLSQFQSNGEQPFEVFVVGEGNFGKSTIVNALLGQKISRVDFRPETRSFMRYVLKGAPSGYCDIYVRVVAGIHDYLLRPLGRGEHNDLFDTTRHRLADSVGERVLASEADHCRLKAQSREWYTPAILEIERELLWTESSQFPEGVRLVDTQGLNQIFDDDLLLQASKLDVNSSAELFESWMASSPRARHLDWQFRRCDAVLWLVSAQKPNPGATRAALRYLSKYGKAIIIAVTQIDRVQGGVGSREEVLTEVRENFGRYTPHVIPINARHAMESSLAGDKEGIKESGLDDLVRTLKGVFLEDAALVRGISQYLAVKTTEDQMRRATLEMVNTLRTTQDRLEKLRQNARQAESNQKATGRCAIQSAAAVQLSSMNRRVGEIGLLDDSTSALKIVDSGTARSQMETTVDAVRTIVELGLAELFREIQQERFELPSFDADGQPFGASVSATMRATLPTLTIPELSFNVLLSERPIKALKTGL